MRQGFSAWLRRVQQLEQRGNKTRPYQPRLETLEARWCPALDVPLYSSLPGANHTIYLDFDGHITTGTSWNTLWNNPTINSPAYNTDGDPNNFSAAELAAIQDSWMRIAEDYIPFNVNVTTVDPGIEALRKVGAGDTKWGIRVVITRDTEGTGAGGIAYINSFNWDSDTPCFVYVTGGKNIAEAGSHEAGHSLGLAHDGTASAGYYQGHGSGETGWAPLMGVGYYRNVTTWDKGEYFGSNNAGANANYNKGPDDLAVITTYNGFGYRPDDHGNSPATATALTVSGSSVSGAGIIGTTSDVDVFSFTTETGNVTLNLAPFTPGPNLDIRADLYDDLGNLVATSNSTTTLSASFNLNLTAGEYFLRVDGTGFGTPGNNPPTGYSDYASLGRYSISGTIVPPPLRPELSIDDVTVDENAGTATFTVTLAGTITGDVTVDYQTSDDTAVEFADYLAAKGTLVFSPGGPTKQTFTVDIVDDTTTEGTETFFVDLTNVNGATLTDSQAVGTINDDDIPPTLTIDDVTVNENAGTATFTVTLSGTLISVVSVDFETADGTALDGSDYTSAKGTLVFNGRSATQTITVDILDDTTTETTETFVVNLKNVSGAIIVDGQGTGTIIDDDAPPPVLDIAMADAYKMEGTGGTGTPYTFTVTRSGSTVGTTSVRWTVSGTGSFYDATPDDFVGGVFPSGSVRFAAGETSKTITVLVNPDSTRENSEFFHVTLSGVVGATLGTATATGTIINDDGGKPGTDPIPPAPHALLWPDDEPRTTPFNPLPGIHYCGLEDHDDHGLTVQDAQVTATTAADPFADQRVVAQGLRSSSVVTTFTSATPRLTTTDSVFQQTGLARNVVAAKSEIIASLVNTRSTAASTSTSVDLHTALTDAHFSL